MTSFICRKCGFRLGAATRFVTKFCPSCGTPAEEVYSATIYFHTVKGQTEMLPHDVRLGTELAKQFSNTYHVKSFTVKAVFNHDGPVLRLIPNKEPTTTEMHPTGPAVSVATPVSHNIAETLSKDRKEHIQAARDN